MPSIETGRVFVAGHRGMLGHVVASVFVAAGWSVATSDHRFGGDPDDPLLEAALAPDVDVIVNAMGITTQRGITDARLFTANAVFPLLLAAGLDGRHLIHASTDCVFDGKRGGYRIDDLPDDLEPYGLSKRLGERALDTPGAAVTILRTSIIGPEVGSARGLMAWFLAQGGPVTGWTDHRWNGITTLQWAKLALDAASARIPPGLHHPTMTFPLTKLAMLEAFAERFDHRIEIVPGTSKEAIDRTLVPSMEVPAFDEQLVELRSWMRTQS